MTGLGQATIKFPTKEYDEIKAIKEKLSYPSLRALVMDAVRSLAYELGGVDEPHTKEELTDMFDDLERMIDGAGNSLALMKKTLIEHANITKRIVQKRRQGGRPDGSRYL